MKKAENNKQNKTSLTLFLKEGALLIISALFLFILFIIIPYRGLRRIKL